MPSVEPKHANENIEALLRRFKRTVENAGVINDIRKKDFYEKPTSVRKRKKAAAKKREIKDVQTRANKFSPRTKQR